MRSFYMSATSVAAMTAALCLPATAHAQTRTFDVPVQAASTGVKVFAQQAGIEIIVSSGDVSGRSTNAVKGKLDARAALDQLLSGTGLSVRSSNGKTVILGADAGRPAAETVDAITVTGSRIARPELESPMPVSVVSMEQAERAGRFGAYDALRLNPAVAPGLGVENAVNSADAGASFVDLRGLGANRSLTLVDGMRRVSSGSGTSAVDIGMIPSAMIDRIEVVTGGAAAIYGADAVTGATNVITKNYLDGLHLSVTHGVTQHGDGAQTIASIATGGAFGEDRGSFIVGGTYTDTGAISSQNRSFSKNYAQIFANPANTGPNDGIPDNIIYYDLRSQSVGYDPSFMLNGKRYTFNDSGLVNFHAGAVVVANSLYDGGDGRNLMDQQQLRGEYRTYSFISKTNYKITDTIQWTGRIDYGRSLYGGGYINSYREDSRANQVGGHGGDIAHLDNPYLPDFLRALMANAGVGQLYIERSYGNFPLITAKHDRETFTNYQGFAGALGKLTWEAFWQYGRSTDEITYGGIPQVSHIVAARDAIADPTTRQPICRDPAARAQGCVPYSIFSEQPLSQAQYSWLFGYSPTTKRTNTQQVFGGHISGDIFNLPAGPLAIVAGAEHRRETLSMRGDGLAQQGEFTYAPLGVDAFQTPISAAQSVSEAYGEAVAPILKNLPFAQRIEIEAAYRYSHYSTGNDTNTWKVGGSWEPVEGLTFRGVRSRSVRAPNFGELYSPRRFVASGQPIDPCAAQGSYYASPTRSANCAALGITSPLPQYSDGPTVASGGNTALKPETSNSITIGVVARPKFLPGFDLSADYWDVSIDNVIAAFSAVQIYNLCVDLPTINNAFCAAQARDPVTHKLTSVNTFLINAQKLAARGFDFGVNYRKELGDGVFHAGLMGSAMIKRLFETTPGQAAGNVDSLGNAYTPKFKGTLIFDYDIKNISVAVINRYVSAGKFDLSNVKEPAVGNKIRPYDYTDFSVGVDFGGRYLLQVGANNIFNIGAPVVPYSSGPLNAGGYYDVVGRYFYTTLRAKF